MLGRHCPGDDSSPRQPPTAPEQSQRFGNVESGILEDSQPTPFVHRRALQIDSVADIRRPRKPALAAPLSFDIHRRGAIIAHQVELYDDPVMVARRPAMMLFANPFSDAEGI